MDEDLQETCSENVIDNENSASIECGSGGLIIEESTGGTIGGRKRELGEFTTNCGSSPVRKFSKEQCEDGPEQGNCESTCWSSLPENLEEQTTDLKNTVKLIIPDSELLNSCSQPSSNVNTCSSFKGTGLVVEETVIENEVQDSDEMLLQTHDSPTEHSTIDCSTSIDRLAPDESEELTQPAKINVEFDFAKPPLKYIGAWREFSSSNEFRHNNFTKGCKWAPDGSCILTNSEDCCLRIFNFAPFAARDESTDWYQMEMLPVLKMKESDTVYDYCWYPLMNSMEPSTCCFVSTSRLNPIHMWDAYSGEIRGSYRAYNHVDEVVSALSLAFDAFGGKLYCGFDKCIRIFDVSVPGRDCVERSLKAQGQAGIISCISVNPTDSQMYAAGSYLRTISLYTEPKGKQLFTLEGQIGGITHLMFSPDGLKLFSGGRKDPEILCWDLRSPGRVLYTLAREVSTNQRIYFDVDSSGSYVASGNSNGLVSVWDISKPVIENGESTPIVRPAIEFCAHSDCVNGIGFNPTYPVIATSSGQRKFLDIVDSEEEEEGDMFTAKNVVCDNSLVLWWAGR